MTLRRGLTGIAAFAGTCLVTLASATAPGLGAPLAPVVTLQVGPTATPGKAVNFTATTTEKLSSAGHFALELRGIDLTRATRSTYAKPDYTDTQCKFQPCHWAVTSNSQTRY